LLELSVFQAIFTLIVRLILRESRCLFNFIVLSLGIVGSLFVLFSSRSEHSILFPECNDFFFDSIKLLLEFFMIIRIDHLLSNDRVALHDLLRLKGTLGKVFLFQLVNLDF
jgi:hypothetical protein